MDVLSSVMRAVRLEGALFLNADFREPWCVDTPSGGELARTLLPGAERLALCHYVLEGRCWAQLPGEPPVALHAGDVVVLPQGDTHLLGSGTQHAPVCVDHMVDIQLPELNRLRYGGGGERTVVVCGWFAFERGAPNPLVQALPRLFVASIGRRPAGPWIEQSIRHALAEAAAGTPGSNAIGARVAEILFVETLRAYIDTLSDRETGWLAGLRDAHVGKALALMHADPARAWTVAELAQRVHVSRSVLALRFTTLVGVPPMQYLTRWRLALAARLLEQDGAVLARVAEGVGYESDTAFNRAFKREYGVAPGHWRRARQHPASGASPRATPTVPAAGVIVHRASGSSADAALT